ncbi:unnamed protein product [Symbiodinium sp. CCMP2592]|nr:unnamed protein product [Symbiodinium sp. CCMP2592]
MTKNECFSPAFSEEALVPKAEETGSVDPPPPPAAGAPPSKRARKSKGEVLCVLRGESSKELDKPFAEVDANGAILTPVCWDCGDCACQLRPGKSLAELVDAYQKGTKSSADPLFRIDFDKGIEIYHGKVAANFSPAANVGTETSYGLRIIQPYGLLTDSEYTGLLGGLPTDLGKKDQPVQVNLPFVSPDLRTKYWLFDLQGLEPSQAQSVRRVELFYQTNTALQEVILDSARQLHERQGNNLFSYLTARSFEGRGKGLTPASSKPDNLQALKTKHAQAQRTWEAAVGKQQDDSDHGSSESEEGADDAAPVPAAATRSVGFGFTATAAKSSAKRRRTDVAAAVAASTAPATAKAAAKVAPAPGTMQPPRSVAMQSMDGANVDIQSGSSVKFGGSQSKEHASVVARLDPDLKRVAEKHLECQGQGGHSSTNVGIKSLEHLIPESFLLSNSKQLQNNLNGVPQLHRKFRILELCIAA